MTNHNVLSGSCVEQVENSHWEDCFCEYYTCLELQLFSRMLSYSIQTSHLLMAVLSYRTVKSDNSKLTKLLSDKSSEYAVEKER